MNVFSVLCDLLDVIVSIMCTDDTACLSPLSEIWVSSEDFKALWIFPMSSGISSLLNLFQVFEQPEYKAVSIMFFYHRNTSRIIFYLPFSLFFFNFNEQFLKIHQKSRNQNVLSTEESRMYECWQQEAEKQTDGLDRRKRSVKRWSEEEEEL